MVFQAISAVPFSSPLLPTSNFSSVSCLPSTGLALARKRGEGFVTRAAVSQEPLTGIVFQPFEEVKKEELMVPIASDVSLARQRFAEECEAAINEQIKDNVALKGFAKFFKESSEEEREHAEKLMKYQNKRGGKVKLHSLQSPPSEFSHVDKGEALYAMELALALEKLTNEKLFSLHAVACRNSDVQMADYIESEFLGEQVEAIKKIAEYVSQLRRVGKGHGVWHFDQVLLHEGNGAV